MIDNIIFGVIHYPVSFILGLVFKTSQAVNPETGLPQFGPGTWISLGLSLIISVIYYIYVPLRTNGQTLGKKLTGIRIRKADESPLTAGTLFLREFIGKFISTILLLIGYLMALGQQKRALHDYLAGTVVVKQ